MTARAYISDRTPPYASPLASDLFCDSGRARALLCVCPFTPLECMRSLSGRAYSVWGPLRTKPRMLGRACGHTLVCLCVVVRVYTRVVTRTYASLASWCASVRTRPQISVRSRAHAAIQTSVRVRAQPCTLIPQGLYRRSRTCVAVYASARVEARAYAAVRADAFVTYAGARMCVPSAPNVRLFAYVRSSSQIPWKMYVYVLVRAPPYVCSRTHA